MKCSKAQDLYFSSRDGALDEPARMALARHLAGCPSCARHVAEMDLCLDAARALPEMAAPEGFEWNVKRRILQEKSHLMRSGRRSLPFGDPAWVSRFAAGAAAAAVVLVSVAFFAGRELGRPEPRVKETAEASRPAGAAIQLSESPVFSDDAMGGSTTGPQMVSDNIFTMARGGDAARPSPFQTASLTREDSLARENALLKRRIERLERQNMLLNGMLDRERMQRLETSLP